MKNQNLIDRLEELEAIARRWNLDKRVYTSFDQENNKVRKVTWSQKAGNHPGDWIEFEKPTMALDYILEEMTDDQLIRAQIGVDDLRTLMDEEDRLIFDTFFPDAPSYSTWFDLRNGQDPLPEAVRMWKTRTLAGVKYNEWWTATNARIDELLATD